YRARRWRSRRQPRDRVPGGRGARVGASARDTPRGAAADGWACPRLGGRRRRRAALLHGGHRGAVAGPPGPLYGRAFIEAGFRAGSAATIDLPLAASMLEAATDGLARRGRCTVGGKTILDTLSPAAMALTTAGAIGADAGTAARATVRAALAGVGRPRAPLHQARGRRA